MLISWRTSYFNRNKSVLIHNLLTSSTHIHYPRARHSLEINHHDISPITSPLTSRACVSFRRQHRQEFIKVNAIIIFFAQFPPNLSVKAKKCSSRRRRRRRRCLSPGPDQATRRVIDSSRKRYHRTRREKGDKCSNFEGYDFWWNVSLGASHMDNHIMAWKAFSLLVDGVGKTLNLRR